MLISCRFYTSHATDAREGALSAWDRSRVALHAMICPYCRRFDKTLDATLALLRGQPPEPVAAPNEVALLAKLRQATKP